MTSTQPYSGTDFYCDVALPDPDSLDVVHEDERVLVYHHTRPFWAVHLVAVPKRHIPSLTDTCGATDEDLCALFDADRKSTRLNSSHVAISYAVFCLKKKTAIG